MTAAHLVVRIGCSGVKVTIIVVKVEPKQGNRPSLQLMIVLWIKLSCQITGTNYYSSEPEQNSDNRTICGVGLWQNDVKVLPAAQRR